MLDFSALEQAGPTIYAILAGSIVGTAYTIYCALVLRRSVVMSKPLIELAESVTSEDDCVKAEETCRKEGGPFAGVLLTVLETRKSGREESESMVESAGRRAAHDLSNGVLALEVVAAISPLLGLLGTVMGMYKTFRDIANVGVKEVGKLSGGISEALVTTICGLIVAIPAYIAFTWFARKVDALVLAMEEYAVQLMTRLRNQDR